MLVRGPNFLFARSEGDITSRLFSYDGKAITLFDLTAKVYATTEAPATLDALLDSLHEELGFSIPTAKLLLSDPYKVPTEQAEDRAYVGLHEVGSLGDQLWIGKEDGRARTSRTGGC